MVERTNNVDRPSKQREPLNYPSITQIVPGLFRADLEWVGIKGWEAFQVVRARSETVFWQYPKRIPAQNSPGTICDLEG